MRRFELSDGKSNKFWQVSADGAQMSVTFGKIGTNGQTQTKDFGSPGAANAEMEKLIKEKTKKGYSEVSTDGLPAPKPAPPKPAVVAAPVTPTATATPTAPPTATPAPTPHATSTTPSTSARLFWSDAARALLDADKQRGGDTALLLGAAGSEAITSAIASARIGWSIASAKWEPPAAAVRDKLLATFASTPLPSTIDPDLEAAAATLVDDWKARGAFLGRWLTLGGPAVALDVLARMWSYRRSYEWKGQHEATPAWLVIVDPATNWDSSVCAGKRSIAHALRTALDAPARAAVREAAAKLHEHAGLPARVGLAYALDDAAFANADAEVVLALPESVHPHDAKLLLRLVDDAALLKRLVDRFGFDYYAFRPALVAERVGLPAGPLLAKHVAQAGSRDQEIDSATALSVLECEETARTFATMLERKGVAEVARDFFSRRPDLAFGALGAVIAAKGKTSTYAEPIAQALVREHPATLEAIASSLDAKVVTALRELGVVSDAEDATIDELPRVLARPPWLEPVKKTAPPTVEGLALLPFEERTVFSEGQRAISSEPSMSRRDVRQYLMRDPPPESDQAAMDAFILSKLPLGMRYLSGWLESMSEAGARAWLVANDISIAYPDVHDLRWMLVRFGVSVLPTVLRFGEKEPSVAVHALEFVESPQVARFLAKSLAKSRKRYLPFLNEYFTRFPEASAIGILPLALAKSTQKAALPALQMLAEGEREKLVRDVAARYGDAALAALEPLLALDLETKKLPTLPAWFAADKLPPVLLRTSERRLPASAVTALGMLLAMSEPREAHDRLDDVKAACTPDSLARFAWGLFQTWLAEGADGKQSWAFTALGHLGGDDAARRITPLIRAWPGESAHARAVKGLDVLAQIGSDVALMHLDAIAEKVKFKGLQENAREKIEEVAKERELTRDELADRIAPTLDLDPNGSRVLSFGPRSFRVGFDEHLAPFVSDETGKRVGDLPKPRATDDAEIATAATQAWKALKKDAKAVASSQIHRLERAMCMQRRWTEQDFRTLLVDHPLVVHLVRRLVWAVYDGPRMKQLFRVAEDRSFADAEDGSLTIASGATIGLPHRLELADDDLRRWGQVFGDYEIVQPFPQMDRDVYAATDAERDATALERTKGFEVPTGKVLGLEARGWHKGAPQDAGWIWEMYKTLPGDFFAELPLEGGLLAGAMAESPPSQKLGALVIKRGAGAVPFGQMPPLVFSELVRDLEGLRA